MLYNTLIDTATLHQYLDDPDWRIIDCRFSLADTERGRRAYVEGHIPGAVYAHLDEDLSGEVVSGKTGRHPLPAVEDLARLFSAWGVDEQVQVVAYDDKSGAIAARLWWLLHWLGHEQAAVLDGGWPAWVDEGYPSSQAIPAHKARRFEPKVRDELLVDAAAVRQNQQSGEKILIDSRAAKRYHGEEEPIDPVAGHIEGAKNAPFGENIGPDGRLLDKEGLRQRFTEVLEGKTAEEAIFYCGSGVTACHNLLAAQAAGLGEGKLYAGSWSEWILVGGS